MRAIVLEYLYEWSKKPYQKFLKKNRAWNIPIKKLLQYPNNSLGFHLAAFLLKHSFEVQPKLENHDVFHVLTSTGISVPEEISMQYFLLGNGKKSLYLFSVIGLGTCLYPDYSQFFKQAYQKGRTAHKFYHLDFSKMLEQPLQRIQSAFLIQ
ncbi:Coq4 family protein [Flagellimonas sp.]|uniref:Coq4 family protein n=1 Tax=Flagellimonas sp. TaxID=2058762 RepID=UPI003F49E855